MPRCRPHPTGDHRDDEGPQELSGPGSQPDREDRRGEGRDAVLTVDTDVEQVHPEPDRHRDGREVNTAAALMIWMELAGLGHRRGSSSRLSPRVTEGEKDRRRHEEGDDSVKDRGGEAEQVQKTEPNGATKICQAARVSVR